MTFKKRPENRIIQIFTRQLSKLRDAWPWETRQPEVSGKASSGDKMVGVDNLSHPPPAVVVSIASQRPDKICNEKNLFVKTISQKLILYIKH
jgi:hypothetical protein